MPISCASLQRTGLGLPRSVSTARPPYFIQMYYLQLMQLVLRHLPSTDICSSPPSLGSRDPFRTYAHSLITRAYMCVFAMVFTATRSGQLAFVPFTRSTRLSSTAQMAQVARCYHLRQCSEYLVATVDNLLQVRGTTFRAVNLIAIHLLLRMPHSVSAPYR